MSLRDSGQVGGETMSSLTAMLTVLGMSVFSVLFEDWYLQIWSYVQIPSSERESWINWTCTFERVRSSIETG